MQKLSPDSQLSEREITKYALAASLNRDVKNLIEDYKFLDRNNFGWTNVINQEQWQFLADMFKIVLSKNLNPVHKKLLDRVVSLVRPFYLEIQKWMDDHPYIDKIKIDIEDKLYWSFAGLVDRVTTAKQLVRNEHLAIQNRFELACNYCFKYPVKKLWNLMSESEKRRYSGKNAQNNRIVDFWIKWVTTGAKKDVLLSPDRDFDQLCFYAYYTNSIALNYFLHLLTTEDREQYLTKIVQEMHLIPRVMHFCLVEMNSYQKTKMFKKNPFKSLKCCLDFPWQSYFLIMALHFWPYLRKTDFAHLIYFIIYERIVPGWDDHNYIKLLVEFWMQSPNDFKEYLQNEAIVKVLNFIVGQVIEQGFLYEPALYDFLNDFILPETIEKRYQKACRSC